MWLLTVATVLLALYSSHSFAEKSSAKEFKVKLVDGFAPYAGQVSVYHAGSWGMVCSDGWDKKDALVVCKELGFPGVTMVTNYGFFGVEETISIEHVGCYGNETRLSECSYKITPERSECRTGWGKGAGVICEAGNNTDPKDVPKIRLTGPSHREGSGNVEVFINRQWGRICDDSWDFYDARVVCRELGFHDAESSTCCGWYFGTAFGPPLMDYVDCTGHESSLFYCRHEAGSAALCSGRNSAGVICKLNKTNVRLVGSPLLHAGFVQIRRKGRWGSFCDWSWGLTQGHVVCRELGYRRALFTTIGGLFEQQSSGPIWVEEAACTGNESSIHDCDLKYISDYKDVTGCEHRDSAGVICESNKVPGLNETAVVRLQGSNVPHMGRVEIKQQGIWHAVCSIGFDIHDADVVCRQLGFSEAVLEVGHGQFGFGTGPMWLTSVRCQGNETSLDKCVSAGWRLEPACVDKHGAGVVCRTPNITSDGEVRLRGSNSSNAGRVEVQFGGVWGLVSDRGWDIRDGHVVCRQLGYIKAVGVYTHARYGLVNLKIWLSDVQCSGEEKSLLECSRELNYDIYASTLNAGVDCTNDTNYTSEVEVRLVGMDKPNAGHVQIKYNGTWGTICAMRDLTYQSAEVICRQLGHGPPIKHNFMNKECTATNDGAEKVWLSNLNCRGFEDSVDECPHRGWGRLDSLYCEGCTPQYCSTCLICKPRYTNITDLHVRLVGSNVPYSGRVEVQYGGVWGVICPRHLNGSVFRVICRQLGYEDVMGDESLYQRRSLQLYGDDSKGPVWLSKVYCQGNETSLAQCEIESPGEIMWCTLSEALELMCQPRNHTPTYPIRLAGSSVPHAGRLEVLYNGTWGAVCSNSVYEWSVRTKNDLVACRQLGFGVPIRSPIRFPNCPANDRATGAVWLSEVRCRGNESSLDQCPSLGWGKTEKHCRHDLLCLVCDNSQYRNSEIMVRLSGSEVPYAGLVQVRYLGVWGTLCGYDWKTETGEVLCRQLGYTGVELDFTKYWYSYFDVYDAVRRPVWFNSDGCNGEEKTLSECQLRQELYCSKDDLQLICKVENSSVNVFPVRLSGSHPREGRAEVFYGGLWGTVGAKKWDTTDALVLCRQLGFSHVQNTYTKTFEGTKRVVWFGDFECQGREATLGQCRHRLIARASSSRDERFDVFVHCGNGTLSHSSSFSFMLTVVNTTKATPLAPSIALPTTYVAVSSPAIIPRNVSVAASVTPTIIYSTNSSTTIEINTWKFAPTSTLSAPGSQITSTPATKGPSSLCPEKPCQNGGTCRKTNCRCREKFAGVYCEVYVGDNAVSMVLKMTMGQWKASEFKITLAAVLTKHCSSKPCLQENEDPDKRSQKKALRFRPDDIVILQGYPRAWNGMKLLNVRLVVKMPTSINNSIIPREIMSQLLIKIAPKFQQQMGVSVAFIGHEEITSAPPDASGRNSNTSWKSSASHESVLIALGVVLGVIFLVAIVTIVWYRRKRKREKHSNDEDQGENVRLVEI